ncbi:MAG: ATP synthase subunit I [Flavitalea sp.]
MSEISYLVLAFIWGVLLGLLFFGGLWFTIKKAIASKIPSLWVLGSFIFRVSIALAGFYFIGLENWRKLVICMLGFILSRFMVIHFTKSIDEKRMQLKKEAEHGT